MTAPTPRQPVSLVPLTVVVPAGVRSVEIVRVLARWKSAGGIQLGTREVKVIPGMSADLVMQGVMRLIDAGALQRVVLDPETKQPVVDPETKQPKLEPLGDIQLALVKPPQQPPQKRILEV